MSATAFQRARRIAAAAAVRARYDDDTKFRRAIKKIFAERGVDIDLLESRNDIDSLVADAERLMGGDNEQLGEEIDNTSETLDGPGNAADWTIAQERPEESHLHRQPPEEISPPDRADDFEDSDGKHDGADNQNDLANAPKPQLTTHSDSNSTIQPTGLPTEDKPEPHATTEAIVAESARNTMAAQDAAAQDAAADEATTSDDQSDGGIEFAEDVEEVDLEAMDGPALRAFAQKHGIALNPNPNLKPETMRNAIEKAIEERNHG